MQQVCSKFVNTVFDMVRSLLVPLVFAIVNLPKTLSAGDTLEVFENKILGPDVKLFLF